MTEKTREQLKAEIKEEILKEELKKELLTEMGMQEKESAYSVIGDQKDRIIASLLAFFLGYIGIHRFYLNDKNAKWFLIAFICTFGIAAIITWIILLIDMVKYLQCNNNAEFTEKYANK